MAESVIDLRSDTVTKPSPEMRRAMAEAEVGDDVFIEDPTINRPQTALISLENTHNMAGGTVYPTELAREICNKAHDAGIPVHLDGARVFNAATFLGQDVAEMTKEFDSIQFCLSKGLGAPVGSMILGTREFIERSR